MRNEVWIQKCLLTDPGHDGSLSEPGLVLVEHHGDGVQLLLGEGVHGDHHPVGPGHCCKFGHSLGIRTHNAEDNKSDIVALY